MRQTAGPNKVFWFVRRTRWSSAFKLLRAANMLKHELQRFTFTKKTLRAERPHLFWALNQPLSRVFRKRI
ncbi:MAG: hypothetical protein DME19_05000 [Verrucomicrobia bacterium]|nr:MAG: hypothetical protein DME19_05000 [Verrucomicrobiota bacterium]